MAASKSFTKLASLALQLENRRKSRDELQDMIEAAERAGLVVPGERELLSALQALLDRSGAVLARFTNDEGGSAAAIGEGLAELEAIADDVQWELASDVTEELAALKARQEELVAARQAEAREQAGNYLKTVRELSRPILDLDSESAIADEFGAPVREERRLAERLKAIVARADRAVEAGQFAEVDTLLNQLREESVKLPERLEQLKEKHATAKRLTRQADLLLIRSDLASKRYQYTLLLRTPSERGAPGIDIQDESTMVEEDHKFLEDAMDEIAAQVNQGLVRSSAADRPAPADTSVSPPAAPLPDVETAVAGAVAPGPAEPVPGEAGMEANAALSQTPRTNGSAGISEDVTRLRRVDTPVADARVPAVTLLEQVGDLMYRLVVPETMQLFLVDTKSSVTIRTNDVALPWELMRIQTKEGDVEYLCLDRPVARMPTGRAFPRRERHLGTRDKRLLRFLLIYSDPDADFPLKAAKQEVDEIKAKLSDKVGVMDTLELQEVTGKKLNRVLLDGYYDVIHYAGHAAFDKDNPDLSGLLLWQKEVFFAQKARRLLEGRPLVFVNACESGRTANEDIPKKVQWSLQRPAEGILSSFIYGGAASCIGSIWPVYDQPAREFAIMFYEHVLEGYMVGHALLETRKASKAKYPKQVTWASFVMYGDPTARLAE